MSHSIGKIIMWVVIGVIVFYGIVLIASNTLVAR